jgi:acetyltransferase-like isoleucine patch superfamily enzyme
MSPSTYFFAAQSSEWNFDDDIIFSDGKIKERLKTSAVKIGKECFIGTKTIIAKRATIGDRVIGGSGSLVLTDIPDNGLVGLKIR